MNRVIAGAMGLLATGVVLVGCSNDKATDKPADTSGDKPAAAADTKVSSGSNAQVKVDGSDLAGLDLNSVTCVKQGGKINVGSAAVGGQQGLGVVMTDEATPKVESLGLVYDGSALAVSEAMGVKVGSAEVKVDGDTYTITGEASGADMKNPMAGMINKPFTITVSCS
ncbi:lipoprotein LpqH [Mycolicibacterium sp. 050232]|uniref:lipoprotein LpqH n=1 Tax=Mycolicibacterium sp. 050232 TaxID=3113982 RepID=UPI002E29A32D|nr:lipoprotein LpqH [Mycolicibacterium sp. 050232]MED5815983.1 lipoprotein LpqH [Mycolicibacterium sp. 050232]